MLINILWEYPLTHILSEQPKGRSQSSLVNIHNDLLTNIQLDVQSDLLTNVRSEHTNDLLPNILVNVHSDQVHAAAPLPFSFS